MEHWMESPNQRRAEKVMSVIGPIAPLLTIPQIIKIFFTHTHHTAGVSLLTWLSYTIFSAFWLMYGIAKKSKAIILTNLLFVIADATVVAGVLIWGENPYF
jgi:MtN3 and saliva related transmembrane protein